ncbi:MAG: 30S ribosomal protein S8 [Patescibacteria group bacterium]
MVNDPIADFIVQLQNASAVRKPAIVSPYSNLKMAIAERLLAARLIKSAVKKGKKTKKFIEVELAYRPAAGGGVMVGEPRITGVARVSRPSRRVYYSAAAIYPFRQGYGLLILSTPKGILTGEEARAAKIGGEVLFKIW